MRSGQTSAGPGFTYWLLKFDGVTGNRDKELEDPTGYGAIEYAYALMAQAAGITMTECRLLEEGGRRHFMTRRFDRLDEGSKLHMQSLGGLAQFDFNQAGAYAYEDIAFLMDKSGQWTLAPAFDVTYSYNPSGLWTATHQMTLDGKRDGISLADVRAAGKRAGLKQGRADTVLERFVLR